MNYTTYLFDFDYTLANSEKGILICFRHVLEEGAIEGISDMQIKRTIGMTLADAFRSFTGSRDEDYIERLRRSYVRYADVHMTKNTFFYDWTLPKLEQIKRSGGKTGIISTKYRYRIEELFNLYGSLQLVDIIIGMEDVKAAKPDPEGILLAVERLVTAKAETLYVGDNIIDAQAAQNANVDFAAVLTGTNTAEDFERYPCTGLFDTSV